MWIVADSICFSQRISEVILKVFIKEQCSEQDSESLQEILKVRAEKHESEYMLVNNEMKAVRDLHVRLNRQEKKVAQVG